MRAQLASMQAELDALQKDKDGEPGERKPVKRIPASLALDTPIFCPPAEEANAKPAEVPDNQEGLTQTQSTLVYPALPEILDRPESLAGVEQPAAPKLSESHAALQPLAVPEQSHESHSEPAPHTDQPLAAAKPSEPAPQPADQPPTAPKLSEPNQPPAEPKQSEPASEPEKPAEPKQSEPAPQPEQPLAAPEHGSLAEPQPAGAAVPHAVLQPADQPPAAPEPKPAAGEPPAELAVVGDAAATKGAIQPLVIPPTPVAADTPNMNASPAALADQDALNEKDKAIEALKAKLKAMEDALINAKSAPCPGASSSSSKASSGQLQLEDLGSQLDDLDGEPLRDCELDDDMRALIRANSGPSSMQVGGEVQEEDRSDEKINYNTHKNAGMRLNRFMQSKEGEKYPHMQALFESETGMNISSLLLCFFCCFMLTACIDSDCSLYITGHVRTGQHCSASGS